MPTGVYERTEVHRQRIREAMSRPEVRAKISEATREAMSRPEVRAKISEATREAMSRPEVRARVRERTREAMSRLGMGTLHADGLPGYHAAHTRIKRRSGSASTYDCVDCGEQASDWSYIGGAPDERRDEIGRYAGCPFSLDPAYYEPRCRPCHRKFDTPVLVGVV